MVGKTLGRFRIGEQLGRGGMGEVYLADDTSLDRKVALKFIPDAFAGDPERMARFDREAKLLASLNHPNIAAIHGLEQAEEKRFIVMEFVEGETLAQRLSKGPLDVDEALGICRQISDGLKAAHEKGVIHRDLKPANVMLADGDKVKILDFGLAKALSDETQSVDSSHSPTLTDAMTRPGVILGTAAYMSPEQAKGKSVDERADIWAFGCILYECLTGKKAFEGETVTETLAAILKAEPNWQALPATAPPNIRFLLRRCLEKNMSRRFQNAADVRIVIEEAGSSFIPLEARAPARSTWKVVALVLMGLILAAVIGGIALWSLRSPVPAKVTRFSYLLPEGLSFSSQGRRLVAISPDGTNLVYVANGQLYLRRLSESEARPIPGTQQNANSPFFSPDGQYVGFYASQDGALKKIPITGGAAVTLCKASNPFGVSWQGETIVFGQGLNGILAVPAIGGAAGVLVKLEPGESADGPQMLPGGDSVLFAVAKISKQALAGLTRNSLWDKADIVVHSLKTGKRKVLLPGGSAPRYLSTGHIIYALGSNLLMAPIDLARLEVTGGSVPIVEGVMRTPYLLSRGVVNVPIAVTNVFSGAAHFDFSIDGTLVYVPSSSTPVDTDQRVLAMVDRDGKRDMLRLPPELYDFPRISPDGKQLAFIISDEGGNIYVCDMSGRSAPRRLTFEGLNSYPVWSPDSRKLAFYSYRENKPGIFLQAADGADAAERLANLPDADGYIPNSWSPDGKTLAFTIITASGYSLWTVSLAGERKAQLYMDLPSTAEAHAAFSPDGNWMAYMSGDPGRQANVSFNIYVQPFPKAGAPRYQISQQGRNDVPLWSPHNGKELFYFNHDSQKLMAVSIQTQPAFSFGQPVPLPIEGISQPAGGRRYDIMPDGKRFLVMLPETQTKGQARGAPQINVVLNWFEELKKKQGKQ